MFDSRRYVIIPADSLPDVDFSQVLQTSPESCRLSVDGTLALVKYDGTMPSSVAAIPDYSPEYTHEQILEILNSPAWTDNQDPK